MKLQFKVLLGMGFILMFVSCTTTWQNGTTATLRPDLSNDDSEVWMIESNGNDNTSADRVKNNALKRAAFTSNDEGYDCFILLNSEKDAKDYSYTTYKKTTVNSETSENYHFQGSTNYYGSTGYSGYANTSGKVSGYANTAQEVYVPQTYNYREYSEVMYVVFNNKQECEKNKQKQSKWRNNVYMNKDFLFKSENGNINKQKKSVSKWDVKEISGIAHAVPVNTINFKTVKIGDQVWMAENLNLDAPGSKCYDNKSENCAKYGRLYNWNTAINICPSGWHLPTNAEWDELYRFADETNDTKSPYTSKIAGKYLKARNGWNNNGNGQDKFGFAALPGGGVIADGNFSSGGNSGAWWSATESDVNFAYGRGINGSSEYAACLNQSKTSLFSVRCVQD